MKVTPGISGPVLRRALGHLSPYPDEVWTTLDGRRIKVGDMDEQHVRNAFRMLIRANRLIKQERQRALRQHLLRNQLRSIVEKHAEECIGEDRKWGSS